MLPRARDAFFNERHEPKLVTAVASKVSLPWVIINVAFIAIRKPLALAVYLVLVCIADRRVSLLC